MKKFIFTIIVVMMMTLSMKAQESGSCGDNLTWYWNINDSTLTIVGTGDMWDNTSFDLHHVQTSHTLIKHLVIEEGVTSVGVSAFEMHVNLHDASLPSTLISIGDKAFRQCVSLVSVEIPDSVTTIGEETFYATDIESLTLGNSVSSMGRFAFADNVCLKHVVIPNSLKTISEGAFYKCKNLESVDFGDSLVLIDNMGFQQCSLATIHLPNTLQSIGISAFADNDIVTLTLGESLSNIGDNAFHSDSTILEIYCNAIAPPYCNNSNTFNQNTYEEATLYVPIGCKSLYENADSWKRFFNIVESNMSSNENDEADISIYPNPASDLVKVSAVSGQPSVVRVYNTLGMLVEEFEMNSSEIEINVSDYKSGMYFIEIQTGEGRSVEKMIVK